MAKLSGIILKTFGWKSVGEFPDIHKSVVVLAPHTSNWDFVIGKLHLNAMGISNNTLMKNELFFFPLNIILNKLGGIPIDRKNRKGTVVAQVTNAFKQNDEINLFIAPEGTRKKVKHWKKGFYHIAKKADVPIMLSYIDYKKKEVGITKMIDNTDTYEDSIIEINEFYKDINAKHPENFKSVIV
jgi:1-acyl-sn-glycerol-3-phosphate acyltransferase